MEIPNGTNSLHFETLPLTPFVIEKSNTLKKIDPETYASESKSDMFVKNISQISQVFSDTIINQPKESTNNEYDVNIIP